MEESDAYTEAYKRLNKEQQRAVETIEGPVMVVAGPGTGKTQIIALRIAYILKNTDTPAGAILALTFTESGVVAIRKRLVEYIGSDGYDVHVYTFHGFSNSLIQNSPDEFPRIVGSEHIDEIRRIEALRNILSENSFDEMNPATNVDYYVNKVSSALRDLKREGFTPEDFERLITGQAEELEATEDLYHEKGKYKGAMKGKYKTIERRIKKNRDLLKVYRRYEEFLRGQNLYDYEDMIIEVLSTLETDNDFLLSLQETYLYVLADEHQDANESQNRLLFLLSSFHKDPNLFVVGDDKQAIYRFQGASLRNFLSFTKRFPSVSTIELKKNYRSTQSILNPAFRLISNNPTLSEETLQSTRQEEGEVSALSYSTADDEATATSEKIEKLMESDIPPNEIAVLVRRNKDIDTFKRVLARKNIPLSHREDLEKNSFAQSILTYLRAVADPTQDEVVARALFSQFLELPPKEIVKTIEKARKAKTSIITTENDAPEVTGALETIINLHARAEQENVLDAVEISFKRSGMVAYALREQNTTHLEVLDTVFGLARTYAFSQQARAYLNGFLEHLDTAREFNIDLPQIKSKKDGVRIMTVHRSKGLEFDVVFVPQLDAGHWGKTSNRNFFYIPELKALSVSEKEDPLMDERRLCFVALTRARKHLFLSLSEQREDGKETLPSPFLHETEINIDTDNATHTKQYGHIASENTVHSHDELVTYIQERFAERGVTATGVNAYLECPNKYLFQNLIRLPEAQSANAQFGTVIHEVLQEFSERQRKGERVTKEDILAYFKSSIKGLGLDEALEKEYIERGITALDGYIDKVGLSSSPETENERNIRTSLKTTAGEVVLSGKIDKIEHHNARGVIVTDYKTGKVRSPNHIEGKTKDSSGNYKRQLVFYSLLLEQTGQKMKEGVIDFIEPNERGYHKRHSFTVSQEEKEGLVETITEIVRNIESGDFVSSTCDDDTCEWCALHKLAFSPHKTQTKR